MTTPATTETTTPTASPLDTALGKIDALLATPAPGVSSMTNEQLQTHAAAELEKAIEEATTGKAEASKARLEHLKTQIAAAKAIYDSGATLAPVTMFKDPWQSMPTTKVADPAQVAAPNPAETLQQKEDVLFVTTEKGARAPSPMLKGLIMVAKASAVSPLHKRLMKMTNGAQIIAKAGEAMNILSNIATMFGISVEDSADVLDYEFKWDVADTISALQSAAKLEGVISQMSGTPLAATAKAATPSVATPPAAPVTPSMSMSDAWPTDMATAVFDEKTGLHKAAGETPETKPYWGLDSERAPTT